MKKDYKVILIEIFLLFAISIVLTALYTTQPLDRYGGASVPFMIVFSIIAVVLVMYIKKEEPAK